MYAGQICVQDYSNKINHINRVSIAFLVIIFTSWWCYKNHLVISLAVAVHEHPSPKLYVNNIGLKARTYMYAHTRDKKKGLRLPFNHSHDPGPYNIKLWPSTKRYYIMSQCIWYSITISLNSGSIPTQAWWALSGLAWLGFMDLLVLSRHKCHIC